MKRIFTLIGIAVCGLSQAQMTIRPNSSVFVNNTVLYVDQGIDIQNNANLYLRREAQLLQNRLKTTSTNSGTGSLSVYQEGTSDEFDYNYWAAPVGIADATNGNRPFNISLLNRPTGLTTFATSGSTTGLNGAASPLTISSYWIWTFVASTNYAQWVHAGTGNITPGLGFTMKGTDGVDNTNIYGDGVVNQNGSGQRYEFRGRPNDANISFTVAPGQWTLTGNPYPSALFVDAFLLDPTNTTAIRGEAYYWEHQKSVNSHFLADYEGGYGTYVPMSIAEGDGIYTSAMINTYNPDGSVDVPGAISTGLAVRRDYAPIGQGFMVEGLPASSGTATLRNSHRAFYRESQPLSHFERTPAQGHLSTVEEDPRLPQLRINATINNASVREMALAFVPYATDGVDHGFDGRSPNGDELPSDVAFKINDEKYVIQSVAFDVNKRLPLIVKSTGNASFRFNMPAVINFDQSQEVFIFDALDNTYHSLNNGATYELNIPTGTYTNRFEVTFRDAALGTAPVKAESLGIVQNNQSQQFTISNPQGIELKSCSLYDMAGKLIMSKDRLGNESDYNFSTSGYSEGVYIVKVVMDNNQDFGQKISVHRPRQ